MRTDDILIRPARRDDIPAIATIYAHAVTNGTASFELDPPDEAEMLRRFEALAASGHPYLAAERDGVILGYAYAGPYRPRPAYRATVEDSIYLSPSAQRLGIGRLLLRRLLQVAEDEGFRQMVAVIGDSSHHASIRLHESLGFRLVGTLENVGYKHGRWLDSVLMQRKLGPGAETPPTR